MMMLLIAGMLSPTHGGVAGGPPDLGLSLSNGGSLDPPSVAADEGHLTL